MSRLLCSVIMVPCLQSLSLSFLRAALKPARCLDNVLPSAFPDTNEGVILWSKENFAGFGEAISFRQRYIAFSWPYPTKRKVELSSQSNICVKTKKSIEFNSAKLLTNIMKSWLFIDNYHCVENLPVYTYYSNIYSTIYSSHFFNSFFYFLYFRYYDSSDLRSSTFSKWDDNSDSFWKKDSSSRDADVMLTSKSPGFSDRYTKKT